MASLHIWEGINKAELEVIDQHMLLSRQEFLCISTNRGYKLLNWISTKKNLDLIQVLLISLKHKINLFVTILSGTLA